MSKCSQESLDAESVYALAGSILRPIVVQLHLLPERVSCGDAVLEATISHEFLPAEGDGLGAVFEICCLSTTGAFAGVGEAVDYPILRQVTSLVSSLISHALARAAAEVRPI